ncbi:response regulator [Anaerolineales bacterium HSG24]|nr:response regulator [Anaerolineales bacterium HSG24]
MNQESKSSILIVDDNPTNLGVLFNYLKSLGFKVFPLKDAEKGLNLLQKQSVDLVLLDIMMPGMNGYEMCRRLKDNPATQDIPIIFMSALSDTVDKIKGLQMGAVDYITKPFQQEEVLARIKTHIQLRTVQKQLEIKNQALKDAQKHILRDLNMARHIQHGLLLTDHACWNNFDVVCYTKAARQIGGDFYNYRYFPENNSCSIAVGDVSGKGVPAALLMATCLTQFDSYIMPHISPKSFVETLDKALAPYLQPYNQNCAFIYVKITFPESSSLVSEEEVGLATFVNAGCLLPIIKRHEGSSQWVDVGGLPLGVGLESELGYMEEAIELRHRDMIILCSDGVVEAMNEHDEMFGFDRFEQAVESFSVSSLESLDHNIDGIPRRKEQLSLGIADLMVEHIKREIMAFAGNAEPHDDLTIVVIQFLVNAGMRNEE